MNTVYEIIGSLNKEESRHLKLLMARTNDTSDRKDIRLFDQVRKAYPEFDEERILRQLYNASTDKNVLYRLKNRLAEQIDQSLSMQYFERSDESLALHYINLSRLFYQKRNFRIASSYLKKAEKKARSASSLELLDLIYSDYIRISQELVTINPEIYIEKRRSNRKELADIQQIDDVLAVLSHRIKVSQNFSKESKIVELLQNAIREFTDARLHKSTQLRFKIYNAVSRILLQQADYRSLETYLLKTYKQFTSEKLFNQANHDTKLQMITYIINTLFKNRKIQQSLEYAEVLKSAMSEHNKMLYDKYLFFYYNSLVINYSEIDKEKAVAILEEAKTLKSIQKLPVYTAFIYLNLSVLFFDLGQFKKSLKSLVHMKLQDDYKTLDEAFRLRINIAEIIIRYELKDTDMVEKLIADTKLVFGKLLGNADLTEEKKFLDVMSRMIYCTSITSDKKLLALAKQLTAASTVKDNVIDFRAWLREKMK